MPYMHPLNASTAPPSHLCLPGNSMTAATAAAVGGAGDAPPPPPTPTVSDLDSSGSKKGAREVGGLPPLPLLSSFDDDILEATKNDDGNDDGKTTTEATSFLVSLRGRGG